ncbi:YxiG family protein [Fusibacter sp. JL216-2]|uniref:YxiG family protein n=1 Tax=Fusibacter sp. JL216-2 TaxID=3071453 RepID=UPI003D355B16
MSMELNPWLDQLDSSKIDSLKIDLEDQKISFKLKPQRRDNVDIQFEGVNAFYYIDDSDTLITADTKTDLIQSIAYHKGGFGEFASVKSIADLSEEASPIEISIPNFAISLNDKSMYIEARSIHINGNAFNVL